MNEPSPLFEKKRKEFTNDPVLRLKYLSSGFIGNLYLTHTECNGRIPCPIFDGEYLDGCLFDGTIFRGETLTRNGKQIKKVYIKGPDNLFTYKSELIEKHQIQKLNPPEIEGHSFEKTSIELKDGTYYEVQYPSFNVKNVLSKSKTLAFTNTKPSYIWDKINNIIATFHFHTNAKDTSVKSTRPKQIQNWFSSFSSKNIKNSYPLSLEVENSKPVASTKKIQTPVDEHNSNQDIYQPVNVTRFFLKKIDCWQYSREK